MLRTPSLLLTLTLVAAALAGCTGDDTPPTTTPETTPTGTTPATTTPVTTPSNATNGSSPLDSSTFVLETTGAPTQAKAGEKVSFTLFVNGTQTVASDHVGAHYATNDTTNPPGPGRQDCEHANGTLSGVFNVSCTFATEGTYYVWGHARVTDDAGEHNWWAAMPFPVKVRAYNLTLSGVPTSPVGSKANFTFALNVTGMDNATSDHIGAHFWNASEANPTLANAAGSCQHVTGGAVGNHTLTCSIESSGITPKEFYLRGHLRLVEGATTLEWWSAESTVTVSPVGLGGLPG